LYAAGIDLVLRIAEPFKILSKLKIILDIINMFD